MPKEIGYSGTEIFSGFITEDYNVKLQFPQSIDVFEEMRKGDATVQAVLKAIKLPIINGTFFVTPASDDKRDIEIAEFVNTQFFKRLVFKSFISKILIAFDFGFMTFEKVFQREGDKIFYKKFADRLPKSIQNWITTKEFARDHEHPGIEQNIMNDLTPTKDGRNVKIPGWKLFRYTVDQEGENYEGVSILRAPYKHWFMKNSAYKIELISAERTGAGIPVARKTVEGDIKDAEKAEVTATLKGLRANEKDHLIEPFGWEFRFESPSSQFDFEKMINHHDREITKSSLAQFLELGVNKGALSQSKSDQDLFLKSIMAHVAMILEKINRELVTEIVLMNFDNVKEFPKIEVSGIERDDMEGLSNAVQRLGQAGFITPDLDTENTLRKKLKFPEKEEEDFVPPANRKQDDVDPDDKKKAKEKEKIKEEKTEKKKLSLARIDLQDGKPATKRERDFVKNITKNEKIISKEFSVLEKDVSKINKSLDKFLTSKYKEAKTIEKNGEIRLSRSGNSKLIKEMTDRVSEDWDVFNKKWNNASIAKRLADEGFERGSKSTEKLSVAWAARGFRFNISKVIKNAPINVNEKINDHFGTEAVVAVAIASISSMVTSATNDNQMKLSFETYPRSSFKQAVSDDFPDVEKFKMVLPEGETERLLKERPGGFSILNVFTILTIAEWAKKREDENGNPIIFPVHPNSKDYYLPILPEDEEEEKDISRKQRKLLEEAKDLSLSDDKSKIANCYNRMRTEFLNGERKSFSYDERGMIKDLTDKHLAGEIGALEIIETLDQSFSTAE